jgi:hypothetical protein
MLDVKRGDIRSRYTPWRSELTDLRRRPEVCSFLTGIDDVEDGKPRGRPFTKGVSGVSPESPKALAIE